ncbi:MAG: sigma-54 dependent transcriptional regulator [Acidobacteriota bacterium]
MAYTLEGASVQVLLVAAGRPVRILAERDLAETGSLLVAFNPDRSPADLVIGQGFEQIALDPAPLGDTDSRLSAARGLSATSELVAVGTDQRYTYLTRPLRPEDVRRMLSPGKTPRKEHSGARARVAAAGNGILGHSAAMAKVLDTVERVAPSSTTVLLHGETGTGKTLLARAVHRLSPRLDKPYVALNCGAFQDTLLESELFGHERGAFTGAVGEKPGLFEIAHQGTLFLDEVGELSRSAQARLLQVLDSGEFRRVGGTKVRRADVRIVAATNRDLEGEVREGRFREDLFFRLSVLSLEVPSLRERRDDIPVLVEGLLDRFAQRGMAVKTVSPEALAELTAYRWPGNVRELANVLEGLLLLSPDPVIGVEQLPRHIRTAATGTSRVDGASSHAQTPGLGPVSESSNGDPPVSLAVLEHQHVQRALSFTAGNKAAAARLLGIDVKTLYSKLKPG